MTGTACTSWHHHDICTIALLLLLMLQGACPVPHWCLDDIA
jgi:hypothetical protein